MVVALIIFNIQGDIRRIQLDDFIVGSWRNFAQYYYV